MPNFSYKALGRDGKEVRGVLQAESEAAAASRIRENYPILLSISQKKEKKRPDDGSLLEMEIGSRRIKTKKLAILCSQFAITLHSGMTVARAMRMLADQNEDKRIRKIMGAAAEEVAAGSTVASALEKYSDRFPLTFIETIRAGEQSGTLEHSFDRLQKFYEKSYKTTEKIKGAMTYPLFVVAVAVVVLIIVMAKVIPTLADVFTDLGGTLPLMTRMLIATSHFFAKWWLLMLAVLAFLKIGSQVYGNTPQGRIQKAKIALSLPLVGAINQMNGAAQFANTMSVLLAAGITINQAVDTTAKVMDNALLSDSFAPCAKESSGDAVWWNVCRERNISRRRWSICVPSEKKPVSSRRHWTMLPIIMPTRRIIEFSGFWHCWNRRCWWCLRFLRVSL